jgi:hypothetical protein
MAVPRFRFSHYRVPKYPGFVYPKRGKPSKYDVSPYSRSAGWISTDIFEEDNIKPLERGGMTFCEIVDDEGIVIANGISRCSFSDNFNYRMGRNIAGGRAMALAKDYFTEHFEGGDA